MKIMQRDAAWRDYTMKIARRASMSGNFSLGRHWLGVGGVRKAADDFLPALFDGQLTLQIAKRPALASGP
jgi:hypothetical protein